MGDSRPGSNDVTKTRLADAIAGLAANHRAPLKENSDEPAVPPSEQQALQPVVRKWQARFDKGL